MTSQGSPGPKPRHSYQFRLLLTCIPLAARAQTPSAAELLVELAAGHPAAELARLLVDSLQGEPARSSDDAQPAPTSIAASQSPAVVGHVDRPIWLGWVGTRGHPRV